MCSATGSYAPTGFVYAARMLMAYQPFVDQLGRQISRIGLDVYSIDGRRLLHAFGKQQVEMIRSQGRYAHFSPHRRHIRPRPHHP
jgi:hypothetical protein